MTSIGTAEDVVRYRRAESVATIELNRPHRLNAVTDDVGRHLSAAFERAGSESAPVVVLTGAGRSFCSGHDLTEAVDDVDEAATQARLDRLQNVTRRSRALHARSSRPSRAGRSAPDASSPSPVTSSSPAAATPSRSPRSVSGWR